MLRFIAVICAVLVAWPAAGQESDLELDKRANQLYQQVLSPFCAGRSLNDCPSSKAHELKLKMREQLAQGVSEDVILDSFFKEFGVKYRAVPERSGFGLFAWLAPIGFLVLGLLVALKIAAAKKITSSDNQQSQKDETRIPESLRKEIESELAGIE